MSTLQKEHQVFARNLDTLLDEGSDLPAMKIDLAVIKSNYATNADIAKLGVAVHSDINAQTWKLVTFVYSFGTALVAASYFIAKYVH